MTDTSSAPWRVPRYAVVAIACAAAAPVLIWAAPAIVGATRGLGWQIATGSVLVVGMGFQWLLSLARVLADASAAARLLRWHKWVGIGMLCAFILHAPRIGYLWTSALAAVFLGCAVLGALNRETVRRMGRAAFLVWYGAHVALAAAMVPLVLTHIWIALIYE